MTNWMSDILTKIMMMLTVFFAPLFMFLIAIGLAILLDTIFGRWKASSIGEKVTSKKTRHGVVSKVLTYNIVAITIFIIDNMAVNEVVLTYLPYEFILTKSVVLFLIWMEASSIDESYEEVKGYKLSDKFIDFIKTIKRNLLKLVQYKQESKE